MSKSQNSKRSRKHQKQARFAGLKENTGHPSHKSGNRRLKYGKSHKDDTRRTEEFKEQDKGEVDERTNRN